MDWQARKDSFTPTPRLLDQLIRETEEVAGDAGCPLYMLDHAGRPHLIEFGGGNEYELHPWTCIIDTLLVDDTEGRVHWMHPDLRTRLDGITKQSLLRVVPDKTRNGAPPGKIAQELFEDSRRRLAAYDARRMRVQPIVNLLTGPHLFPGTKEALQAIEAASEKHGLETQVFWRLAQVLRKVPVSLGGAISSGASLFKATVLSQLIDPKSCSKPGFDEAYGARLTVEIHREPSLCPEAIDTLARAIAHDVFSIDPDAISNNSNFAVDLLIREIAMGLHDPFPDHDVKSSSMASRIGEMICGPWTPQAYSISAHDTIRLVSAANDRLDALGIKDRLCPADARDRAEKDRNAPF